MSNDVAQVVMAISTVFEVLVCVLVVVMAVVVAVVVVVVAVVHVVEDTTDSARSVFPEVLWLSRYDRVAVRPGTVGLSLLRERCRL